MQSDTTLHTQISCPELASQICLNNKNLLDISEQKSNNFITENEVKDNQ